MKTLIIGLTLFSLFSFNEWNFKANPAQSQLVIKGTSSVHDWESEVKDFKVSGVMSEEMINNLNVEITVKSIKSGKSIMDDKTYEALKADKFAKVQFMAPTLNVSGEQIVGNGTLVLAGQKKSVPITAKVIGQTASSFTVQGAVTLDMTEYGIEPPTAMFGTLETGETVTIEYQLLLNK